MQHLFSSIALLITVATSCDAMEASSRAGQKLLSNSRLLAQNDNERDVTWIPYYSIKFEKCHSLIQVGGQQEGGGEQNTGSLYSQHLVEYSLCPSDSCSSSATCKTGAKYITNLREFAQLYTEYQQEKKEDACEVVRQNCYNDDEYRCFTNAGMDECIEVEGQEEVNLEEYMECQLLENGGNNNNNNKNNNYNYGYNNVSQCCWCFPEVLLGLPVF